MLKPVAVILLNWNTPSLTLKCIDTLLNHNDQDLFDVFVADNGSSDASLELFKEKYPHLKYIENGENLGFAEGNNRAIAQSIELGYKYSFLLNSDTEVWEDVISPLYQYMEGNKQVGAVQPAIFFRDDATKLWNGGSYFNRLLGITYAKNDHLQKDVTNVDWVTGCSMFLRNSVLKEVGLFNKAFFLYYEDVELSLRIKESGSLLKFFPAAKVFHAVGGSGKNNKKGSEGEVNPIIHYYNVRNKIWNLRRNGVAMFYPIYWGVNILFYGASLFYFIVKLRFKKARMMLKGVKDGLFTPASKIW